MGDVLRRKGIRLDQAAYAIPGTIFSVTIGLRGRIRYFADAELATAAVEVLRSHSVQTGVAVFGYCLMPDHVHLLVGPVPGCDLVTFVGQFKNLTQRAFWRLGRRGKIWQQSFWDHLLRAEEDVAVVLSYILNNPVRAGLVRSWRDYPFAGSLIFTL